LKEQSIGNEDYIQKVAYNIIVSQWSHDT